MRRVYIDCQEKPTGSTRTIKQFNYDGKTYVLDSCVAGGVDIEGEGKGCQNFVCIYGKKRFFIYCEEEYKDGKLKQRYFVLKGENIMPRKEKYYGTLLNYSTNKMRELGFTNSHNQFRIVCKAKSRAEANRIAKSLGLVDNIFRADYTSETFNAKEIELADKYGFIISKDSMGSEGYVDIRDVL